MTNLANAGDLLCDARQLVEAIRMAATDLDDPQREIIQAVARMAVEKLEAANTFLTPAEGAAPILRNAGLRVVSERDLIEPT